MIIFFFPVPFILLSFIYSQSLMPYIYHTYHSSSSIDNTAWTNTFRISCSLYFSYLVTQKIFVLCVLDEGKTKFFIETLTGKCKNNWSLILGWGVSRVRLLLVVVTDTSKRLSRVEIKTAALIKLISISLFSNTLFEYLKCRPLHTNTRLIGPLSIIYLLILCQFLSMLRIFVLLACI